MKILTARFMITLLIVIFICQGAGAVFSVLLIKNTIDSLGFNKLLFYFLMSEVICLILTFAGALLFFVRYLSRPASDFNTAINKAAAGNLIIDIKPPRSPLIGTLVINFNALIVYFRNIIRKLYASSNDIASAIEKIKPHTDKITEDTNSQFASTEKVAVSLKNCEKLQVKILNNTNAFTKFFEENMAVLTQINSTVEEAEENLTQLSKLLNEIYSLMSNIAVTAKEIFKRGESLSTATDESIVSVMEIMENLKEIEKSSRQSVGLTKRVRGIASDEGMLSVANAMEGMEEISDTVAKNFEFATRLGTKSKNIEKVLAVIANVTKQTNLLSLNAAILAEQAGEYGKGFSVIAEEIKTLSDKTDASRKEIKDIINMLREEIAATITVSEKSAQVVETGVALIVKTGEAFREVIDTAKHSDEMAQVILKATSKQVGATTQITTYIELMQVTIGYILSAALKQVQESDQITIVAEKLKEMSEFINRNLQEQSSGTRMLTKNFDAANNSVKDIISTLSEHGKINLDIIQKIDMIKTICYNTATAIQHMGASFKKMEQEAQAFKKTIEGLKFE
jgi:methyl-accepting chemotaxis protein